MLHYNLKLKSTARELRNNMTRTEMLLWSRIRKKQIRNLQFYRQRTIGNYIVDFYCPKAKLVVEIDGGQHYNEPAKMKDKARDEYLQEAGLTVLRFNNNEVFRNTDGVLEVISEYL